MTARILLVDDSRTVRLLYQRKLQSGGHEVDTVEDVGEALLRLRDPERPRYELVITDKYMPGSMEGLDFVRVARQDSQLRRLPILMLTGSDAESDLIEGLEEGVSDYMQKRPNDKAELLARVRNLLRMKQLEDELEQASRVDQLTGLSNRRHGVERLGEELTRSRRHGRTLSVALVDVDHFKRVNDTYGHQAGDEVLVAVATELRRVSRATDVVIRWGGEEFLFVFPETGLDEAGRIVERFRDTLEHDPVWISNDGGRALPITISGGVARLEGDESLEALVDRADAALYRAKEEGRNRLRANVAGALLPV